MLHVHVCLLNVNSFPYIYLEFFVAWASFLTGCWIISHYSYSWGGGAVRKGGRTNTSKHKFIISYDLHLWWGMGYGWAWVWWVGYTSKCIHTSYKGGGGGGGEGGGGALNSMVEHTSKSEFIIVIIIYYPICQYTNCYVYSVNCSKAGFIQYHNIFISASFNESSYVNLIY